MKTFIKFLLVPFLVLLFINNNILAQKDGESLGQAYNSFENAIRDLSYNEKDDTYKDMYIIDYELETSVEQFLTDKKIKIVIKSKCVDRKYKFQFAITDYFYVNLMDIKEAYAADYVSKRDSEFYFDLYNVNIVTSNNSKSIKVLSVSRDNNKNTQNQTSYVSNISLYMTKSNSESFVDSFNNLIKVFNNK